MTPGATAEGMALAELRSIVDNVMLHDERLLDILAEREHLRAEVARLNTRAQFQASALQMVLSESYRLSDDAVAVARAALAPPPTVGLAR